MLMLLLMMGQQRRLVVGALTKDEGRRVGLVVRGVVQIGLRERVADVRAERGRAVVNAGTRRHGTPIDSDVVDVVAERPGEQRGAAAAADADADADTAHQGTSSAGDRQRAGCDPIAAVRSIAAASGRRRVVESVDQTSTARRRLVPVAELPVRRRVGARCGRREQTAVATRRRRRQSGRFRRQLGRVARHGRRTKQPPGLLHVASWIHRGVTSTTGVQRVNIREDMIAITRGAAVIRLNSCTHHVTSVHGHVLRVTVFLLDKCTST